MALNPDNGFLATQAAAGAADALPIFNVERVQLNFNIASDFVAGQVANNVLILALATNRILRIDLENPSDIDGQSALSPNRAKLNKRRCRPPATCLQDRPDPPHVPRPDGLSPDNQYYAWRELLPPFPVQAAESPGSFQERRH